MTWLNGFNSDEIQEMVADSCVAYNTGVITAREFVESLGKLGYNATDIADLVEFHKPTAPENDDEGSDSS